MTHPVLIDVPMPIVTERLTIRPVMPGDGREVHAAIVESLKELREWMPWAQEEPTLDEVEIVARQAYARWILREDLRMQLFDRSDGSLIGTVGFHRMNWDVPRLEIGYWVRTSRSGKGYVTEAVAALTKFAFEALAAKRVEIRCDAKNHRSRAVAERLGYLHEATLRGDSTKPSSSEPRDTVVYARFDAKNLPDVKAAWQTP